MLMCVGCYGLDVSKWKVHPSDDTSTKPSWKSVFVYISFIWFVYVAMCPLALGPTLHISYTLWHDIDVLKVPLNTKHTNC